MPSLSIDIDNLQQIQQQFYRMPLRITKEVGTAIDRSIQRIAGDARGYAPANNGNLRQSIAAEMTGIAAGRVVVRADYAAAVHEGTRPHMPPWGENSSLAKWADKKGIPPFLVARSIAEKGTPSQPFLRKAVEDRGNQNFINNEFSRAVNRAIKSW